MAYPSEVAPMDGASFGHNLEAAGSFCGSEEGSGSGPPTSFSSLLEILVLWLVDLSPQCLRLLRASLGFSLCLCVVPVLLFL